MPNVACFKNPLNGLLIFSFFLGSEVGPEYPDDFPQPEHIIQSPGAANFNLGSPELENVLEAPDQEDIYQCMIHNVTILTFVFNNIFILKVLNARRLKVTVHSVHSMQVYSSQCKKSSVCEEKKILNSQ